MTLKTWSLIIGVVIFCIGIKCLPVGFGANPKRDLSIFNNFADLDAFAHTGIILLGVGLLIIVFTLLTPIVVRSVRHLFGRPTKRKAL